MTETRTAYGELVGSFDHEHLAHLPAYHVLRQALNDVCNEADPESVRQFLEEVRDMALTTPYGDTCEECRRDSEPGDLSDVTWPCSATRNGDFIVGLYICRMGHTWKCSYHVDISAMFG